MPADPGSTRLSPTRRTPDQSTFQSGDFVWPKVPGQYVPYRSGSTDAFEADRSAWLVERSKVLGTSVAAKSVEQLEFLEFYERYMDDAPANVPMDFSPPRLYVGHVGIILLLDGVPHVVEALFDEGVTVRSYDQWLGGRSEALVWHGRLKHESEERRMQIAITARGQVSKPFKFFGFDLLDESGFYCSKLCWFSVYTSLTVPLDGQTNPKRMFWYSPKQMLRSGLIDLLFVPDQYAKLTLPGDMTSRQVGTLVAEPGSWYLIGKWLAEGAIAYLGGKAIASILGDGAKYDLDDVRGWIEDAIKSIQAFVSAELHRQLDQKAIELITDELSQARLNMLDYDAAKNMGFMFTAVDVLNLVVPRSARYGLDTVWVYADAVSIKLIAYAALIHDHGWKEYKVRVAPTVDAAIEQVEKVIDDHMKYLEDGIASVTLVVVTYEDRHPKLKDAKFVARFQYRDGAFEWREFTESKAYAKGNEQREIVLARFKAYMTDAQKDLHPRLREVENQWRATRAKLVGRN